MTGSALIIDGSKVSRHGGLNLAVFRLRRGWQTLTAKLAMVETARNRWIGESQRMSKTATFDLAAAHAYFSADCFNRAWDLMEKKNRTARDDQMMVALSHASIFHWSNRPDCDDQKLAIGYWQASRVQALIDNPSEAARLGEICLSYSGKLAPFFLAYAHEALARARKMLGDQVEADLHLAAARELLGLVKDDRDQLATDLEEIANS